ncbi:MAG: Rrf2 family transcriptional regulator [Ignavibacteria bacterium]|nr:Rrf2 family transcriptional regulator [Ignavibacteria bacterium]
MSIIFSKGCEYGIQATLYIATRHDRRVGIREIARELKIPVHFLAKILQSLSEKGILLSFKGTNGGFTLNGDPGDVRLIDVVTAIDGQEVFEHCLLGFPNCSDINPCPVHPTWGRLRTTFREMLTSETLADIMPASKRKIAAVVRALQKTPF